MHLVGCDLSECIPRRLPNPDRPIRTHARRLHPLRLCALRLGSPGKEGGAHSARLDLAPWVLDTRTYAPRSANSPLLTPASRGCARTATDVCGTHRSDDEAPAWP